MLAHTKLNAGREAAERALLARCGASAHRSSTRRDDFDEGVTGQCRLRGVHQRLVASGQRHRRPRPTGVGLVDGASSVGVLTADEAEQLSASYRGGRVRTTGPSPTLPLLDELVHRLGPLPELEDREVSLFLDDDASVSELVTTMERLEPKREIDPFATAPRHVRAHPGRRGAGHHADAVADAAAARERAPAGRWSVTPQRARWPDPSETEKALTELVGTAPVRRFRMSTNYRSPAEVFDLAAKVVVHAYPNADLPTAVRSTGIEPELRTTD